MRRLDCPKGFSVRTSFSLVSVAIVAILRSRVYTASAIIDYAPLVAFFGRGFFFVSIVTSTVLSSLFSTARSSVFLTDV